MEHPDALFMSHCRSRDSVQTRVVHACFPLLWALMSSVESDPREALSRLPRDAAFCLSGRVAFDYLSGVALARELFEVLCTVLEVRGALVGRSDCHAVRRRRHTIKFQSAEGQPSSLLRAYVGSASEMVGCGVRQ